eukprot:6107035-Alexandrium_andersonii.AAC.1
MRSGCFQSVPGQGTPPHDRDKDATSAGAERVTYYDARPCTQTKACAYMRCATCARASIGARWTHALVWECGDVVGECLAEDRPIPPVRDEGLAEGKQDNP